LNLAGIGPDEETDNNLLVVNEELESVRHIPIMVFEPFAPFFPVFFGECEPVVAGD
jgi:hypothetical protein